MIMAGLTFHICTGRFMRLVLAAPFLEVLQSYLYDSVMGRFHFRKVQAIFSEARKMVEIMMKICR